MTEMPDEIRPLVGIRGIATAWVVGYHLVPVLVLLAPRLHSITDLLASSLIMVDFFFMLSGFVITYRYLASLGTPSPRATLRYLSLRFARIWPVHAAVLVGFLVFEAVSQWRFGYGLEADNTDPGNVIANLLMLHEIPPFTTINPPSWSLAPEFAAYLAFPLLALALVRVASARAAFATAAVVLAAGTVLLWMLYDAYNADGSTYVVAWARIAVSFPTGCLLAVGWGLLPRERRARTNWDMLAVLGFAGTGLTVWLTNRSGEFDPPVLAYPFLALTVLACAGSTGVVARVLGHPFLEWSGRMSYSVYVTHFLVIIVVYGELVRHEASLSAQLVRLVLLIGVLALIVAVGVVTYYGIEEPARKSLRRLTHRRWGRVATGGGVSGR